jgi:hypothetical protein
MNSKSCWVLGIEIAIFDALDVIGKQLLKLIQVLPGQQEIFNVFFNIQRLDCNFNKF